MPEAHKREPVVPAKMKVVIKELIEQPTYDLAAAAAKAELSTYQARKYLTRPHVQRYMREQRDAVTEEIRAGNPMALARIRDQDGGNTMAKVAAVRGIEQLGQAAEETGGVQRHAPGLVVVIQSADGHVQRVLAPPMPPLQIDAEAERAEMETP
jgi:hypothetical protein